MITADQIKELPLNHSQARRLLTWTWTKRVGDPDALTVELHGRLERWQTEYPERVLFWTISGTALGIIQISALVEWPTSFKVSMKARELTESLRARYQYEGAMPRIESVGKRSGGNLRRTDGARDDSGN